MALPFHELNVQVEQFIHATRKRLNGNLSCAPDLRKQNVIDSLSFLVQQFGTMDYGFNLAMERYVENLYKLIHEFLPDILAEYQPDDCYFEIERDRTDIAFAAYYALSLIYKKENKNELLKSLISEYDVWCSMFYPLAYEIQSRYHKRMHQYAEALRCDSYAIHWLQSEGICNYALGISFASTVCRMYEQGNDVKQIHWQAANKYINDAIAYNPAYPKYHFLRGKLIFYSHRAIQDSDLFHQYCQDALTCAIRAQDLQRKQLGKHYQESVKEYQKLIDDINSEIDRRSEQTLPFLPMCDRELNEKIADILDSSEELYCRPPNPNLKPGRKFVFISYSHADYKSVYCDLLRLYSHNICFQYDGNLCEGKDWEEEVHQYLSKEECIGVLFFISKSTPLSAAIEKECQLLKEQHSSKFYFSVNLEGSMPPTEILMHSIIEHGADGYQRHHVSGERIINFLTVFNDRITYISKPPVDGPDGSKHINHLIKALLRQDPALQLNALTPSLVEV